MQFDHETVWPDLLALAEAGQDESLVNRVRAIPDPAERVSLFRFAIRKLAFEPWANRNLDVMIALADAAIEDCEALGEGYLEQANLICYNTAANLADCWGDGFEREARHFKKGLHYAQKALWYREHLGKGAGPKAMAWWAIGKHHLSLGDREAALSAFQTSFELEVEAAGGRSEIDADAPVGLLIAAGYLALVQFDQSQLVLVRAALDQLASRGGDARDDAEIIGSQLRETERLMNLPG